MKIIEFKFMNDLPQNEDMEENIIYVSLEDDTSKHLCMCGCQSVIVTPISPVEWQIIYNGKYSLQPSIGNWQLHCKSHYWIRHEKVIWARKLSDDRIDKVKERDLADLNEHIKNLNQKSSFICWVKKLFKFK